MSDMVTVRWRDGAYLTAYPYSFSEIWRKRDFGWLDFCFQGHSIACPDTPENRDALGLAKKENSKPISEEFRAVCVKCGHGFDVRENFNVPCRKCRHMETAPPARQENPKCHKCGYGFQPGEKALVDRLGRLECFIACQVPPAREVLELEGDLNPERFFLDSIRGVGKITTGAFSIDTGGIWKQFPDTPRNRWVLRQAGIEVKE